MENTGEIGCVWNWQRGDGDQSKHKMQPELETICFPNPELLLQFREAFLKSVQHSLAWKAAGERWAATPPLIRARINELSAAKQVRYKRKKSLKEWSGIEINFPGRWWSHSGSAQEASGCGTWDII